MRFGSRFVLPARSEFRVPYLFHYVRGVEHGSVERGHQMLAQKMLALRIPYVGRNVLSSFRNSVTVDVPCGKRVLPVLHIVNCARPVEIRTGDRKSTRL